MSPFLLTFAIIILCNSDEYTTRRNIAIVDSSNSDPTISSICNRNFMQLRDANHDIITAWYDNPHATTALSESKESATIYLRYLKDSKAPLTRKSRDSWWPLSFSIQKDNIQEQQFNIFYAGRAFYGIDNTKFKLSDAKELDRQILRRIFSHIANNATLSGIYGSVDV